MPKRKPEWLAFFPLRQMRGEQERADMDAFLRDRLREGNAFAFLTDTLRISSPSKDEVFKAAAFVSHENPLGRRLFYTVRGYDEQGQAVLNTAQKADLPGVPPVTTKIMTGGRITIPRGMRIMMNLVDGDRITLTLNVEGKVITITPAWRAE